MEDISPQYCFTYNITAAQTFEQVLTVAQSYDDAINQLKEEVLSAPVYYISAGSQPNQGAIITRDRNVVRKFTPLNVSLNTDPNSWYLLETNYVCTKDNFNINLIWQAFLDHLIFNTRACS